MAEQSALHIIARIHSDFPTKFGIPRQSGLVEELKATIVFEPEYRNPDAAGAGGIFPPVAYLAVFPGGAQGLVAHGAPASSGGQYPHGGLCHPLSLPSQPSGPVLGAAGAGGAE